MRIEKLKPVEQTDAYKIINCSQASYITVKAGETYADHEHEEGETLDIMAGKGSVTVDGKTLIFEAPCVINIPGDAHHKVDAETDLQIVEIHYLPPHQWDFKVLPTMGLPIKNERLTFACGPQRLSLFEGYEEGFTIWPVWFRTVYKGHPYAAEPDPNGDSEIIYFVEGNGSITFEGETVAFTAPCVTWLAPNRPYTIKPETDVQMVLMTGRDGFGLAAK
jgi:mannose-6-phosphate isomerase-like protein (cupin superfamily)